MLEIREKNEIIKHITLQSGLCRENPSKAKTSQEVFPANLSANVLTNLAPTIGNNLKDSTEIQLTKFRVV